MKKRSFIQGITIFTTLEMHRDIKKASDRLDVSLSELIRVIIQRFLDGENVKHIDHSDAEETQASMEG